jgi:hypothetical protein
VTLAEAISTVAMAGCRLVPDNAGSVALVVPEGTNVPREVLDVLRAHREQLAAVHATAAPPPQPSPPADDLGEYLRDRGVSEAAAELVVHAAKTFNVPGQAITFDRPIDDEEDGPEPVFFEPGVPILTTMKTVWHRAGSGYFTIPEGTLGLAIPQTWAIADDDAWQQVEAVIAGAKQRHKPLHIPVWLAGEVRALDLPAFTFDGAVAPADMDLLPWRNRGRS